MRFSEEAVLIRPLTTTNENGYACDGEELRRDVFVDVQSVKRNEFYASMQAGISLSTVFVMRAADYEGERHIDYDGKRYRIERTYTKDGESVELNCSEEVGHGKNDIRAAGGFPAAD